MTDQNQSVFGNTTANDPMQSNQQGAVFESLVGPGKKFQDQESLARAKAEADAFIEKLKGELAETREDLKNRLSAEEVAKKIREEFSQPNQNPATPAAPMSEQELAALIDKVSTQKESQRTYEGNLAETERTVIGTFGSLESAQKAVIEKARELGVEPQYLADTAARSPKAFYQMMGMTQSKQVETPFSANQRSTVNTQAMPTDNMSGDKLREFYRDMRKNNPQKYHTGPVQMEIFRLTQEGKL